MSASGTEGGGGAFVLAVAGAAAAAAAMVTLAFWFDGPFYPVQLPLLLLFSLLLATIAIAPAAALIGLPLTWLLARTRSETPWAYPAAGLVAGAALMIGFLQISLSSAGMEARWSAPAPSDLLLQAAFGGVPGSVCGALWWRLHRRDAAAEARSGR